MFFTKWVMNKSPSLYYIYYMNKLIEANELVRDEFSIYTAYRVYCRWNAITSKYLCYFPVWVSHPNSENFIVWLNDVTSQAVTEYCSVTLFYSSQIHATWITYIVQLLRKTNDVRRLFSVHKIVHLWNFYGRHLSKAENSNNIFFLSLKVCSFRVII